MDKIFGHKKNDEPEQVGVASDQAEYQQQQSSTLTGEDESAGQKKKGLFEFGGGEGGSSSSSESESEEGKERQRRRREGRAARKQQGDQNVQARGGGTEFSGSDTSRTPPFTEGYGSTGYQESGEGAPQTKHHGFANCV